MLRELKKKEVVLESVHTSFLRTLNPADVAWDLCKCDSWRRLSLVRSLRALG